MPRRESPSFADYVVIAVTPALIMLLVGSLIFFLLTGLYDGDFGGRLRYVSALFIFAAVLIARISIEEGTEHAMLFGIPLAGAILLALLRFTDASIFTIVGMIALVWWAAHKLTWDCTVLDESQEISGVGLLDSAGFTRDDREPVTTASPVPVGSQERQPEHGAETAGATSRLNRWWQRWLAARRRPHAPGVWVIYFALATLPLIALGQLLIDGSDLHARRGAFRCLVVYVASALALLATTSLLGIRRYLRRRALAMPAEMAGLWIGAAAALIMGILAICFFLPRPQPEYGLTQLTWESRENLRANRHTVLRDEGVPQQDAVDTPRTQAGSQRTIASDQAAPSGAPPAEGQGDADSSSAAQPSPGRGERTDAGDARAQDGGSPTDGQRGTESVKQPGEQREQSAHQQSARESRARDGNASATQQASSGPDAADAGNSARRSSPPSTPPSSDTSRPSWSPRLPQTPVAGLIMLMRWVYWAAIVAVIAFLVVRYRQLIVAALHKFWTDLCRLLAGLFGNRQAPDSIPAEPVHRPPQTRPRAFASFGNPFASHQQLTPRQLVLYTFAALEAWSREHDCPREPEQTAFEFARQLGSVHPEMLPTTQTLADLYSRAVYAQDALTRVSTGPLQLLWRQMTGPSAHQPSPN